MVSRSVWGGKIAGPIPATRTTLIRSHKMKEEVAKLVKELFDSTNGSPMRKFGLDPSLFESVELKYPEVAKQYPKH